MDALSTARTDLIRPHHALNRARRTARMSAFQLAQKAGVEYSTVCRIELGITRNPQEETKHRIADALGVEVFSLWP